MDMKLRRWKRKFRGSLLDIRTDLVKLLTLASSARAFTSAGDFASRHTSLSLPPIVLSFKIMSLSDFWRYAMSALDVATARERAAPLLKSRKVAALSLRK